MLSEIRSYLRERGRAPLSDMAARFESDPDALRGMLDHWITKGRARRLEGPQVSSNCGGCRKCDPTTLEIYEWLG